MADKYPSMSPYTYCANNPVRLVDADGRQWDTPEDQQKANKMREIAYGMIYYYNTQIDQYENNEDCLEYINDLNQRIDLLQEGLKGLDNMENDIYRRFTFNDVDRGQNCFVSKMTDDCYDILITIHSDDLIETRWHECAHLWDYFLHPENKEHSFCVNGILGSSESYKPYSEEYAYKQEFSFSQRRFNGKHLPQFDNVNSVNWHEISAKIAKNRSKK